MVELLNPLPFVSVIIPNYNGEKVIDKCLLSVYNSNYPNYEVILVDDASIDNSIFVVKNCFPKTKIIKNSKNIGFACSINKGIKQSIGEIIVLLNMDTVVKEEWLPELVNSLLSDEKIGIAGSKILESDGITIQHAGGIINNNGISFHIGRGERDIGQYDKIRVVDYVCGASMGFKRKLLSEIGYIDTNYSPLYYEDVDLAFRARRKGYKIIYVPQSILVHRENYSTKGLTQRFYFSYHKNRIRFIFKIYGVEYFMEFFRAEIQWLSKAYHKKLLIPLIEAYFINFIYFSTLFLSKLIDVARCISKVARRIVS